MKKLALAIGLGAYIVFGASGGTLAADRADNTAGAAVIHDNRIDWKATGTNARLLFLNERLYPDTGASAIRDNRIASPETRTNARLLFLNERLYPDTTVWDTDTTFCTDGNCVSR